MFFVRPTSLKYETLDCAKRESHNLNGSPPLYCPMKLNSINTIFQGISRHHIVFVLVLLMLVICGISSSLAQKNPQKRITSLQFGELAEGSRVSVFSDSALSDYEAFRRGDRFYVRIPLADFTASQPNFRGDGFDDVQVQRSGDSILISFKLQLGANARVDQRSNRLDVIFTAPNSAANRVERGSSANMSAGRVTTNAIPGVVVLQNSRNQHKRNPDAAGPMPPASPTANRPRVVTQEFSSTRPAPVQPLQSSHIPARPNQGSANKVHNRTAVEPPPNPVASSSSANEAKSPAKSDSTSTFTASSTTSYPTSTAVAQSTPWPSRTIANSPPAISATGWKKRSELAMQWVSANRVAASVGAFVILSLVVFGVSMIFRKRRKHVKARRMKLPGVQPKNSHASDPEELMPNAEAVYDDTLFDEYVSDLRRPAVTVPSAELNFSQPSNVGHEWAEEVFQLEPATPTAATDNERWITNPSIPSYTIKNEVPEREVFEL